MNNFLRNQPIKQKIVVITLVTSFVALLLACVSFVAFEQYNFRGEMIEDLSVTAEMIGFNCGSALVFDDVKSAEQTMKGLVAQSHVIAACIYAADGRIFATYQRPGARRTTWPPAQASGATFDPDHLGLFHPIEIDGEKIGTIYLESDLRELGVRWRRYTLISILVLAMSSLVAWLLASKLQRVISEPVSGLARIAERVAAESDYSIRAVKHGNDEIGRLIDGFNHMLTQVQGRDAELKVSRTDLERRVEERTSALRQAEGETAQKAAQLRFIIEAVTFSVTWIDYRSTVTERLINPAFYRITGLDPSRMPELNEVRAISFPDDLKRQDEFRGQLTRGEIDDFSMEKRYLRPQGDTVWVVLAIKVYRGDDGRILQEVSTLVDITERKRAELELEDLHRQLLETSRQAGMAEVATGVLHNVGNVLNSVNVSSTLVSDQVRRSKIPNLAKVLVLLDEHAADLGAYLTTDEKGKMIRPYLATLAESLAAEHRTIVLELENLRKNIEHIKDIVAMQQSYAKTSGVVETVSVTDLVEDAIRMNAGSLARHDVDLNREYEARPVITLEKNKVLQIIVNLVRNAKYACDESGRSDKVLTTRITATDENVSITISDNGVGIPKENLNRIFAHGFTTRKGGHGFGLHSGALAAKELGGSLTAQSAGPGLGATFVLTLPFKPHSPHEPTLPR
ncbi:MAG: sensor signal transduction histidine kinase [Verrucomicrobia bacterium]|nr:sensor signal transduction histidine kinase [Verrucomicrobiota bacterium]